MPDGSVAAWEALRLIHKLGLRPRRTISVVFWTNEENGLRGATAYRDAHLGEIDNHVLAIESDNGVFKPTGYFDCRKRRRDRGGQADRVAPLVLWRDGRPARWSPGRCVAAGGARRPGGRAARGRYRYFWFHHSAGDTMDKLSPREMAECVAAMAVLAYVAADMPERFPRAAAGRFHGSAQNAAVRLR